MRRMKTTVMATMLAAFQISLLGGCPDHSSHATLDASIDARIDGSSLPDSTTDSDGWIDDGSNRDAVADGGFVPTVCHASSTPNCAVVANYLPVVTHWHAGQFQYLGTDQIDLWNAGPMPDGSSYHMGSCYPYYSLGIPDYESYFADRYSLASIPNDDATTTFTNACHAVGVPVELLPPTPQNNNYPVVRDPQSDSCRIQVVHASIVDGSLVTVILPPNWSDAAPDGTYPIVINSFYDQNDSLFHVHGPALMQLVGQSGLDGKRGVIGVLTNGSGAVASRSFDAKADEQATAAIAWVADRFHGNRYEVITFGGSRGGYTSLAIASNPHGHDYRTILAVAVAAPSILGQQADLAGPTYPGMIMVMATDTGLADAWKTGWTYPACAGKSHLTGLSGKAALLYVLTGTSNIQEADAHRSLSSPAFIQGLLNAGTQVYLEVTGHDFIVPYHLQVEYGAALIDAGVPVEGHVLLRNGHMPRSNHWFTVLQAAVDAIVAPDHQPTGPTDPIPAFIMPSVHYWTIDRQTDAYQEIVPATYPFTFEGPYKVAPGESYPFVFVGQLGTDFTLTITKDGTTFRTISDSLHNSGVKVLWQTTPPGPAGGPYTYNLQIRKPNETWQTISNTNTPSGDRADLYVLDSEPIVDGIQANSTFAPPRAPMAQGTNWGISEY
ncbi:MAG: hypothetical protein J7M25_13410 [Deltaproteobacteria bacterium]|nr:hypothetical protein [Deltaproteobacteria bacterium]